MKKKGRENERNVLGKTIADFEKNIKNLKSDLKEENRKLKSDISLLQSFVVMQAEITDNLRDDLRDKKSRIAQSNREKWMRK